MLLRDPTVAEAARELKLPRMTVSDRFTAALAQLHEIAEALFTESERGS